MQDSPHTFTGTDFSFCAERFLTSLEADTVFITGKGKGFTKFDIRLAFEDILEKNNAFRAFHFFDSISAAAIEFKSHGGKLSLTEEVILGCPIFSFSCHYTHTHAHMHARTHARTHTPTHARMHAHTHTKTYCLELMMRDHRSSVHVCQRQVRVGLVGKVGRWASYLEAKRLQMH